MENQDIKRKQLRIKRKWAKLGQKKVSKEMRDAIHGYLMSDGYLRNGILTVEQSVEQKAFVDWLYAKLEPLRTSLPIRTVTRIHPKTKKESKSSRFNTRALLHGFHHMWYERVIDKEGLEKYIKKLPKSMDCFFNETFISVWYAGDGTKVIGSLGVKFEVTDFTVGERLRLQQLFLTKFDIQVVIISSGVSKSGTPQWALKIPAIEYPKFRALITKNDLIQTVFPYKLHKEDV